MQILGWLVTITLPSCIRLSYVNYIPFGTEVREVAELLPTRKLKVEHIEGYCPNFFR